MKDKEKISDFCTSLNKPGKEFVAILNKNYNIPMEVASVLENLYDNNAIIIKLDYIIQRLKDEK